MSNTDIQLELRKNFKKLPAHLQYKEWKWMEREIFNKRPIKVSPKGDSLILNTFTDVPDVVKYLKNQGYSNAHSSNVHKTLSGERKTAYGHRIWYD